MENLEELKKQFEELGQKINELENNLNNKNNRSRVNYDCEYYYINGYSEIASDEECHTKLDKSRYNIGNYFKTKEEGEKVLEKLRIYIKLRDLAATLSENEPVDWSSPDQYKFYIYYDNHYNSLLQGSLCYTKNAGCIYCTSSKFLDVAIEEIGEEKLKELFENE